jgi:hypothetical protein
MSGVSPGAARRTRRSASRLHDPVEPRRIAAPDRCQHRHRRQPPAVDRVRERLRPLGEAVAHHRARPPRRRAPLQVDLVDLEQPEAAAGERRWRKAEKHCDEYRA